MKGGVYASCVRNNMIYGSETRPLLADVGLKLERAEMKIIRWVCGVSMKDRRTSEQREHRTPPLARVMGVGRQQTTSEELRKLVRIEPITTVIRSGRLRWYGHVMRKSDEDWVKKCMEYIVEGRNRLDDQEGHG